ncbi:MAG: hypothetical protein PVG02_08275, partial [Anaerolineales bacterium]
MAAEQRAAELRRLGAVSICRLDLYLPASAGTEGKPSESIYKRPPGRDAGRPLRPPKVHPG